MSACRISESFVACSVWALCGQQKGGVKENQAGDQRRRSAQEEEKEDGAVSAFLSLAAITHGRAAQLKAPVCSYYRV